MSTSGRRSVWGWGWEEKFPSPEGLRKLAARVEAVLGGALEPRPPPRREELHLPTPRLGVPAALASFCTAELEDRATHTYGKSYRDLVRGFSGQFEPAPDFVAYAREEVDIQALLSWCEAEKVALVPFGGGTSVVGGVEALVGDGFRGAVSLDLRHLDRVLEVEPTSRAARIQAGALGPSIEAQLGARGFTLRHFPQSFEFSSLGGWIATRAGGHFATLYTHIDDLVESVRMLTPRGAFETRRLPASGAGPQPERWVLGSEGTLGVITEAWMRIQPRPVFRASASVLFDDFAAAVAAARAISQAGLYPANCRLLDPAEALMNNVALDGSSVLILGFESADHPLEHWLGRALELAKEGGGRCPDGPQYRAFGDKAQQGAAASWRAAFLEGPYLQSALVSLGVMADTFETACTWDRFPALHEKVVGEVGAALQRVCGGGIVTCRFTHVYPDGPAPYFTFIGLARRGEELAQWAEVKKAASDALLEAGGTITHHHAVGRTHRPWYERERPPLFGEALRATKRALDPAGILNPGVLIDP